MLIGGNRKKEQNIKEGITVWHDTGKIIIYTENDKNIYDENKKTVSELMFKSEIPIEHPKGSSTNYTGGRHGHESVCYYWKPLMCLTSL